jgi:hypothetical protein
MRSSRERRRGSVSRLITVALFMIDTVMIALRFTVDPIF